MLNASMLKKHNNETRIDRSGDSGDDLVRAGVIISRIEDQPELRAIASAIDWMGCGIVGNHVHRHDRMQSWLTHFAVVLEFRTDEDGVRDLWLLERLPEGINFSRFHSDEFGWQPYKRCDIQGLVSGSLSMLSSIPHANGRFNVTEEVVTRQDVLKFADKQNEFRYNIMDKNCQHFAYDFFRYCCKHHWTQHGCDGQHFPDFSEMLQRGWIENREG